MGTHTPTETPTPTARARMATANHSPHQWTILHHNPSPSPSHRRQLHIPQSHPHNSSLNLLPKQASLPNTPPVPTRPHLTHHHPLNLLCASAPTTSREHKPVRTSAQAPPYAPTATN